MDSVYIADFTEEDRDLLLKYLWDFCTQIDNEYESFNIQSAKLQIICDNGFVDNICGRIIEIYIYNIDAINSYLYDFHNGVGSVQEIVNHIRENKKLRFDNTINTLVSNIQAVEI